MNFNIYNESRITEWIDAMLKGQLAGDRIRTWFYTIFRRWARKQESMMRVALSSNILSSPLLRGFMKDRLEGRLAPTESSILNVAKFDLIRPPTEEWAIRAMAAGELHTFHPSLEITRKVPHWIDFMHTLPERQIRHSVESLMKAVERWDEEALRTKTLIDSTTGVTEVWSDGDHYVVSLDSSEAVKAEGVLMGHCVWSQRYDLRRGSSLFSLRVRNRDRPLATMEVVEPVPKIRMADLSELIGQPIPASLQRLGEDPADGFATLIVDSAIAALEKQQQQSGQVKATFTISVKREHMPIGKPVLKQVCTVRNREVPEEILNAVYAWFSVKYPTCGIGHQVAVEAAGLRLGYVGMNRGEYTVNPNNQPGPIRQLLERQISERHAQEQLRASEYGLIPMPPIWEPVRLVDDDRHLQALGISPGLIGRPD